MAPYHVFFHVCKYPSYFVYPFLFFILYELTKVEFKNDLKHHIIFYIGLQTSPGVIAQQFLSTGTPMQ